VPYDLLALTGLTPRAPFRIAAALKQPKGHTAIDPTRDLIDLRYSGLHDQLIDPADVRRNLDQSQSDPQGERSHRRQARDSGLG
jgi:hypothetical protein